MTISRLFGAALLLLALRAAALNEVFVGVADADASLYDALADYISQRTELTVRFRSYGSYAELRRMIDEGELQGAILTPYHYIMLSAHVDHLGVIGRLSRGGSKVLGPGDVATESLPREPSRDFTACTEAELTPQRDYRPVLITRRLSAQQAQVWPPREGVDNRLRLGVRSEQSTSSFLFPSLFVQEQLNPADDDRLEVLRVRDWTTIDPAGALDEAKWLQHTPSVPADLPADGGVRRGISEMDPFTLQALRVAIADYLLVHELGRPQSRIDLAGVSSHWLDAYTGDRSFFRVVEELAPIPYDPLVLTGDVEPEDARKIASAFLSTENMLEPRRAEVFPVWALPITQPDTERTQVLCRRVPDIHSFIAAHDRDYDEVRRAAVLLAGGSEIRLGLSPDAHWNWQEDQAYFEALKLKLSRPGGTASSLSERPIFLDYTLAEGVGFSELAARLESGEYDVVELNAWEAGRLVSSELATLLGQARYRDRQLGVAGATTVVATDNYFPVVVYAGDLELTEGDFYSQIQNECLAVVEDDASSVNRYVLHKSAYRGTPIADGQLLKLSNEVEILRALMAHASGSRGEPEGGCADSGGARFGLMAEFAYLRNREHWSHTARLRTIRLSKVDIPNAMLLFSRDYAMLNEDLQSEGDGWQRTLRALLQPDVIDLPPDVLERRAQNLRRLRRTLDDADIAVPRSGQDVGFVGYSEAGRIRATSLKEVQEPYTRNWAWVILTAIALMVVATGLLVFRGRSPKSDTEGPVQHPVAEPPRKEPPADPGPPPDFNVFISYRRHDSADITGRIYDRLLERYSEDQVFKDVDDIKPGQNFLDVIHDTIERSNVILVVIGRSWRGEQGREDRIMEPDDVVRLEVGAALEHGIHVIPLYVNGVTPPGKEELPDNLEVMSVISGINIRPDPDFRIDMHRLLERLRELEREAVSDAGASPP